jgi:hypothetical protein
LGEVIQEIEQLGAGAVTLSLRGKEQRN